MNPRFSIVIPVFNRVSTLARALNSILDQTFINYEVIIVDDGSEASIALEIKNLVSEYNDNRVKLIRYKENKNGSYARNVGINQSTGEYICFLDSDDEWINDKLQIINQHLIASPDCDLIYHQYKNKKNNWIDIALPERMIKKGEHIAEYSFCVNKYGCIQSSCIVTTNELAKITMFNEQLCGHQDWDFVLRAGNKANKVEGINRVLTYRHISDGNSGMVSRGLDYHFSKNFLMLNKHYFNLKSMAAFSAYILEPKRLKKVPTPSFNMIQFLAWLYHPVYCFYQYSDFLRLKNRCYKLSQFCHENRIENIVLVGYNPYTEFFIGHHSKIFKNITIVDRHRRDKTICGSVISANNLSTEQWSKTDLIVAMTDHHYKSMYEDIKCFTEKANELWQF